ncbi:MAG: type III-B CRISPR module RAMP protein Cmr1 [Anaerolineae bacterium]|nr:type III-B CRISPR module RAMP protein Cmr1 [Anaerolineae bacterium]
MELTVTFKTLTPFWTGGVGGVSDRLYETGLLGSLRWWYEAIVRGLGGSACDPTEHACNFDEEKYRRSQATDRRQRLRDAGLCDACQVFGATGWRRRFRLEVVEDRTRVAWSPSSEMLNIRPPDRRRGWFLPPGRMGTFTLRFIGEEEALNMVAALLLFLEQWGTLGAKPQLGYGVFQLVDRPKIVERARLWMWEGMGDREPRPVLPDLREFGFFRLRFSPSRPNWWLNVPGLERVPAEPIRRLVVEHRAIPVTPALKNQWRFHLWKGRPSEEVYVFGSAEWRENGQQIRLRSKVAVTWAYPVGDEWEVRGFAWLPKSVPAQRVWRILTDPNGWKQAIPVSGILSAFPKGDWQVRSAVEIAKLLNETKGA